MNYCFEFPLTEDKGWERIEHNLPHLPEIREDLLSRWSNKDRYIFVNQINEELAHAGFKKGITNVVLSVNETSKRGTACVSFTVVPEPYFRWRDDTVSLINEYLAGQITDGWGENLAHVSVATKDGVAYYTVG